MNEIGNNRHQNRLKSEVILYGSLLQSCHCRRNICYFICCNRVLWCQISLKILAFSGEIIFYLEIFLSPFIHSSERRIFFFLSFLNLLIEL